ncbi:MAG: phosphotransferase [Candidatus Dormibacteria bacterium]
MVLDPHDRFDRLRAEWAALADRYLPVVTPGSPWRSSVAGTPSDFPDQGWKLHLSATILSAPRLLRRAGPVLRRHGAVFKGPEDLVFLDRLNTGLDGFSQIGKCLTVYCRSTTDAAELAPALHQATLGLPHPAVPFDRRYREGSAVYYRYGAFQEDFLVDPEGHAAPDRRESGRAVPNWVSDPLAGQTVPAAPPAPSPLAEKYRVFQALRKRGKGGVFLALDVTASPPRLCIVKQGLKHGEPGPDRRDGHWRVRREARALRSLRRRGIPVPQVFAEFDVEDGHYVVLEHVEGTGLDQVISAGITALQARRLSRELSQLVRAIHNAGWTWRDCKPENIIVTGSGELRPLDFEGASRRGEKPAYPFNTPSYRAPLPAPGRPSKPHVEDRHSLRLVRRELMDAAGLTR